MMKKLANKFLLLLVFIFTVLASFMFFKITYQNLFYLGEKEIQSGLLTDFERSSSRGGSIYSWKIRGADGNIYISDLAERNPPGDIGNIVTFRHYKGDKYVRILTINNVRINTYYGFMDAISIIFSIAIITIISYKIKKYYDKRRL
ncbi:MAG: hypothetical protein ACK4R6_14560 [Spirosomataceae bacterium]